MRELLATLLQGQAWKQPWKNSRGTVDDLPVRIGGSEYVRIKSAPLRVPEMDQTLIWVVACLLSFGVVMVYSATIALPDSPRFAHLTQYNFLLGQLKWLAIGMVAATVAFHVPMGWWERF